MSFRAVIWSLDQHDITPTQRLVLIYMSNYANSDDETWPSVATLEDDTGFGKSTIYRERQALCDNGRLTKLERKDAYHVECSSHSGKTTPGNSQSGKDIPTGGIALHKGTSKEPTLLDGDPSGRSAEQRLYDEYQFIVGGVERGTETRAITPSLERVAKKALQEFELPDLVRACHGFTAWRAKKPGDKRFSSVFASHPGGRPLHDHIDFWISQAGEATTLGLPSATRVKVQRAVQDVQRAFGSPDSEAQATGAEALKYLAELGIAPTPRESDGYPTFPQLAGGAA